MSTPGLEKRRRSAVSLASGWDSARGFLNSEEGFALKELPPQFRTVKEGLLLDLSLKKIGFGRESKRGRGKNKERVESERGDEMRPSCIVPLIICAFQQEIAAMQEFIVVTR